MNKLDKELAGLLLVRYWADASSEQRHKAMPHLARLVRDALAGVDHRFLDQLKRYLGSVSKGPGPPQVVAWLQQDVLGPVLLRWAVFLLKAQAAAA